MDSPEAVNRWMQLGLVGLAGLVALAGCGWSESEQAAEDAALVSKRAEAVHGTRPERPGFRALREARAPYLAVRAVTSETPSLPRGLLSENGVVVPVGDYPGDAVLAGRIGQAAGLPVHLVGASAEADPVGRAVGGGDSWLDAAVDDLTVREGLWVGPLDRLLDDWTRAHGYEWSWSAEQGAIEVVRWTTHVFQVNALLGDTKYSAQISTSGRGGDDASVASGQSIRTDMDYKPWEDIEKEVGAVLGGEGDAGDNDKGERAVVSPSSATVTVTGLPVTVERVRRYLEHLNRNILRPITLSAHLYALRLDRGSDLALGLGGVIPEIFGSSLQLNANGGTISIVKPTVAARSSLNATVTALRSVGTASRVLSADIPSLNGQPTEFYDVFDHRYLAEVETAVEDGVVSVKLTPGEVWSGFGLSYVGRIVGNDSVLARITVTIQDAPNFTSFGPLGNEIQLPSAGRRALVVTQHIERGAVLLLSGFSDRQSSETRAGTFDPDIPLPEGERRGKVDRAETVLLVTAEVGSPMGITEFPQVGVGG